MTVGWWWHSVRDAGGRVRLVHVVLASMLVVTVSALIVHAVVFYRWYFVDDAFISLRYSRRLLQGKGLTWTDGERVEGYTNFLWTVLIAAVGRFTSLSLLDVARVLSMVTMSAALVIDVEPEKRHMVLVFLLLALLGLEGLSHFVSRAHRGGPAVAHAFALTTLVLAGVQWHRDPHRAIAATNPWERAGIPTGRFLKRAFGHADALLAVDAAGATPYYAELDAIDMLGLNDRYLAEHPPAAFGRVSLHFSTPPRST